MVASDYKPNLLKAECRTVTRKVRACSTQWIPGHSLLHSQILSQSREGEERGQDRKEGKRRVELSRIMSSSAFCTQKDRNGVIWEISRTQDSEWHRIQGQQFKKEIQHKVGHVKTRKTKTWQQDTGKWYVILYQVSPNIRFSATKSELRKKENM